MRRSAWMVALAGAALMAADGPASAGVVGFDPALTHGAGLPVTEVRFGGGHGLHRFGGGGFHHGGFGHGGFGHHGFGHRGFGHRGFGRHGFGHGGFAYRGGFRHRGRGAAIGAGVAGLAAGALIGGALASPGYGYGYGGVPAYDYGAAAAPVADASAYCARRFKSYDPASGTYLGYDGQRHPCP